MRVENSSLRRLEFNAQKPRLPLQEFHLRIWSPSLSFTNAKSIGGTSVDGSTTTYVERSSTPAPDTITRAVETNVFSGETWL
jgi:hypothetical protein